MFHIRTPSTLTILVVEPTGTNTSIQCLCYLGKGGIAIMYKKELELSICLLINLDSTRIIGIELRQSCDRSVFIFGAFPPLIVLFSHFYQNWTFWKILNVVIGGDFNASFYEEDLQRTNLYKSKLWHWTFFSDLHFMLYDAASTTIPISKYKLYFKTE